MSIIPLFNFLQKLTLLFAQENNRFNYVRCNQHTALVAWRFLLGYRNGDILLVTLATALLEQSDDALKEAIDQHVEFTGHCGNIVCMEFSQDGLRFASASEDRSIRIWNIDRRTCLQILSTLGYAIRSLHFHDNDLMAAGFRENQPQSFTWRYHQTTERDFASYRLIHAMNNDVDPSWRGFNVDKTQGLSENQFAFFNTQGANGKPRSFDIVLSEDEEASRSKRG